MKRVADNPYNQDQMNKENDYNNLMQGLILVITGGGVTKEDNKGINPKSAISIGMCCKALLEMSNTSDTAPFWKRNFYEKFKSYVTNEPFQLNVKWKDLFCKYANGLHRLDLHRKEVYEKSANYCISNHNNHAESFLLFQMLLPYNIKLSKSLVEQKKELIDEMASYCLVNLESKDKLIDEKEVGRVLMPFITDLLQPDANPIAQFCLGLCYGNGYGFIQNWNEGIKYFQLSSNQGYAKAQRFLGLGYELGHGVEKDLKKAFEQLKLSADQGDAIAQNKIGQFFQKGLGTEIDLEQAFIYFSLSADQGNDFGQYNLACMYSNANLSFFDKNQAFKYLSLSADRGNVLAQLNLGLYFKNLETQTKNSNCDMAFKYFKLSASQGNAEAQLNLAFYYLIGLRKDYKQSFKYFKLSAVRANAQAQWNLGIHFQKGYGTPINLIEAFKCFKLSAEQGNSYGQFHLAECYANAMGTTSNHEEALKYYKLSADQGNTLAQNKLNTI